MFSEGLLQTGIDSKMHKLKEALALWFMCHNYV